MRAPVLFLLMMILLGAPIPAGAAQENSVRKELKEAEQSAKTAEQRRERLDIQSRKIAKEMEELQHNLVSIAERVRSNEDKLNTLEEKLAILEREETSKSRDYEMRHAQLVQVMENLIRLSHTPPEAVIVMPGDYAKTLKTAKILGVATAAIREEAESLGRQIEEIHTLQDKISEGRQAAKKQQVQLAKDKSALEATLKERKTLRERVNSEQEREAQQIAELSKKSGNLKELLAKLEDERKKAEAAARAAPKKQRTPRGMEVAEPGVAREGANAPGLRSFARAMGKITIPAAGHIIHRFGENKNKNDTYRGLVLNSRQNAQVVAPYDGQVVFTGPFLEYGKMVIIRHSNDFHTLIAGLAKIDCAPGQFLLEGEPIGAMGKRDSDDNQLYIELRKNNKPIDPAPWMGVGA